MEKRRCEWLTGWVCLALIGTACLSSSVSAGLVFDNGFEGGTNDWGPSGVWSPVPANAYSSTVAREGDKSVGFVAVVGGKRSEFTIKTGAGNYDWGTDYWLGFSLRVVTPVEGFGHIFQHHSVPAPGANGKADWNYISGENSVTMTTQVEGGTNVLHVRTATNPANVDGATINGRLHAQTGSALWGTDVAVIPYETNRWYDFVMHFKLAPDNTGIQEIWMKDTVTGVTNKLVDVTGGVTVYRYDSGVSGSTNYVDRDGLPKSPGNYQKIGTYYWYGNEVGEVLYDAFRIWEGPGGSYSAVAPIGEVSDVPTPPSNLNATLIWANRIDLQWTDNSTNETGFRIERKMGDGSYSFLSNAAAIVGDGGAGTYSDTGLSAGVSYTYRVRANGSTDSDWSNETTASTRIGDTFQMTDNQVVMEAEHATLRVTGMPEGRNWVDQTEPWASGAASNNVVQALPNNSGPDPVPGTQSCRADYAIDVPSGSASSFYVHLLARGDNGVDDSIWVSIDGNTNTSSKIYLAQSTNSVSWVYGGPLTIPSGIHTVTLWMREDGAVVDKLVVKNSTALPTGAGPDESSPIGGPGESMMFLAPEFNGGQLKLDWTGLGQLEWAPGVEGPWTSVIPQPTNRPYMAPAVPGTNRFYRLMSPSL